MDAFPDFAVQPRAGAVHLGHARDVVTGFETELFGKALAHLEAVRLGTENDFLEGDLVAQVVAFHFFGQQQGHRGGAADAGGLHVHEKLELHVEIAGADRNGQRAEPFAPELEARPGGPQAVAHRDLHAVFRGQSGEFVAAGHLEREGVHVLLGIGEDLAFAGGAGRGVHAHHLGRVHAEQGQGVAVAQVGHVREGQAAHVVERFDVLAGADARGGELGAVLGTFHGLPHRPSNPGELVLGKKIGGKMGKKTRLGR